MGIANNILPGWQLFVCSVKYMGKRLKLPFPRWRGYGLKYPQNISHTALKAKLLIMQVSRWSPPPYWIERSELIYITKTNIKIEFPGPTIPHKSQITPHCMPRKHCIFALSFRPFVRPDRFLGRTYIRNGLKYGMLMHYDNLHNKLHFGHGVLSVVILAKFWLSEIC